MKSNVPVISLDYMWLKGKKTNMTRNMNDNIF